MSFSLCLMASFDALASVWVTVFIWAMLTVRFHYTVDIQLVRCPSLSPYTLIVCPATGGVSDAACGHASAVP